MDLVRSIEEIGFRIKLLDVYLSPRVLISESYFAC